MQREDPPGNLAKLDEMLDKFNVPESDVIVLLGQMSGGEKAAVIAGYKWKLAYPLDVGEMVSAVNTLGPPLAAKLEWVKASSLSSWAISYSDIQGMITSASAGDRAALKTQAWRDFFVDVCTNATIRTVVDDLGLDLPTKLDWIKAEMTSVSAELSYADLKPLITAAPAGERAALKSEGWRSFFVDVCTNATIKEAVNDLGLDLVTKLEWIRAELISVKAELSLSDIRDLIEGAPADQREALKNSAWRSFFVDVCTDESMSELVEILFTTLKDKLSWMAAEGSSWDLVRAKVQAADSAQRLALYPDDEMRALFVDVCGNEQMADAVILLGGSYRTEKKPWLEAEGTSVSQYLDALVRTGVPAAGSVAHLTPQAADQAIGEKLGALAAGARGEGRAITGQVAVVTDDDWDVAGLNDFGDQWATTRNTINGWVDGEGRVWIHKDRGNPGTMIHEGLHKWSADLRSLSWHLNEGGTEYFTRKVCAAFTPNLAPGRNNYPQQWAVTNQLISFVGEGAFAGAYFDGNKDGLKAAYDAARGNENDWRRLLAAYSAQNWASVTALLAPATPPAPPAAPPAATPAPAAPGGGPPAPSPGP